MREGLSLPLWWYVEPCSLLSCAHVYLSQALGYSTGDTGFLGSRGRPCSYPLGSDYTLRIGGVGAVLNSCHGCYERCRTDDWLPVRLCLCKWPRKGNEMETPKSLVGSLCSLV